MVDRAWGTVRPVLAADLQAGLAIRSTRCYTVRMADNPISDPHWCPTCRGSGMASATITLDTGTPCERCGGECIIDIAHDVWLAEWEASS